MQLTFVRRLAYERPRLSFWLAAAALVPLTWRRVWQLPPFLPQNVFDASWQAGLHLAAEQRLGFGHDLVFQYGPLGFLGMPVLYFPSTAAVGFVFVSLGRLALLALLLRAALRSFPWPVALVLAYVVGSLPVWGSDVIVVPLLLLAAGALERPGWSGSRVFLALAGPLAAVQLLVKPNVGVIAAAAVVIAVLGLTSRRLVLAWLPVSFAAAFVLAWVAAGGGISEIPSWARGTQAFVAGFSQNAGLEDPHLRWNYPVAAAMLVLLAVCVWAFARRLPRRRAIALALLALAFAYGYFKQGFVRHDVHSTFFFGAISIAALAFASRPLSRWPAIAIVALGVGGVVGTIHASAGYFDPVAAVRAYQFEARTLVTGNRRSALIAEARADVRRELGVSPSLLELTRSRTVHVEPYATIAIWAYGLRWRPLPIFQENVVHGSYLDRRNARFLASERAPERILRERVATVDGEAPQLEAPDTYLAMLCHYREVGSAGRWQVLARTGDRCGLERSLGSRSAKPGETVRVPAGRPGEIVYARFRLERPFLRRVVDQLFKGGTTPEIVLDGRASRFRVMTAGDAHVLDARRFRLERWPSSYRVEFYAVPRR